MTKEQAKENQKRIAEHYKLSHWYGTWCDKCCEVYPKLMIGKGLDADCWYECEVCGKRTDAYCMPWMARDAWNNRQFLDSYRQMSFDIR